MHLQIQSCFTGNGSSRSPIPPKKSSSDAKAFRLGYPASPHGLVKVDNGLEQRALSLNIGKLHFKEAPFSVQHLDVAGIAVVEPEPCQAGVCPERQNSLFLGLELLAGQILVRKRIVDLAEARLNGLLVLMQILLLYRLGHLDLAGNLSGGEDGDGDRGAVLPDLGRPGEEVGEVGTGEPEEAGQGDGGKVGCLK